MTCKPNSDHNSESTEKLQEQQQQQSKSGLTRQEVMEFWSQLSCPLINNFEEIILGIVSIASVIKRVEPQSEMDFDFNNPLVSERDAIIESLMAQTSIAEVCLCVSVCLCLFLCVTLCVSPSLSPAANLCMCSCVLLLTFSSPVLACPVPVLPCPVLSCLLPPPAQANSQRALKLVLREDMPAVGTGHESVHETPGSCVRASQTQLYAEHAGFLEGAVLCAHLQVAPCVRVKD
mgnify:CR=1 FL=1